MPNLAGFKIKMTDGSEYELYDFDCECEAKDEGGRHFKGYASTYFDCTGDDVAEEHRGHWEVHAWWDGDWGLEPDVSEVVGRVRKVTKVIETEVWEYM